MKKETTLGERCREFRRQHILTQTELAEACCVHVNTITRIEGGKPCSMLSKAKIERILNEE